MDIISEIKRYIDLRIDEVRLKISGALSRISSVMMFILVAFGILQLFFIMLCIVLMQSLNKAVGEPWGALIVCGSLLLLFLILLLFRKRLFRSTFDSLFSSVLGASTSDIERETQIVEQEIDESKAGFNKTYDSMEIVTHSITLIAAIISLFRNKKGSQK